MISRSLAAHADKLPRSGYRGSDLVLWHEPARLPRRCSNSVSYVRVQQTNSERRSSDVNDPIRKSRLNPLTTSNYGQQLIDGQ